jgi:hypothetical protein
LFHSNPKYFWFFKRRAVIAFALSAAGICRPMEERLGRQLPTNPNYQQRLVNCSLSAADSL